MVFDIVTPHVSLKAVTDIPLIQPCDDLSTVFIDALVRDGIDLSDKDIVVVAQKIVSKAEDRYVDLNAVHPSPRALGLAAEVAKDPRLVEVILRESQEVLRYRQGVLIVVHRLGFVMANAGIDRSNLPYDERVLLLPEQPDISCANLRRRLEEHYGVQVGVIINDSVGRAWRNGIVGLALGVAGVPALHDLRSRKDLFGRELLVTQVGLADEVAAAASLLMGQADEGIPVVIVRGLDWEASDAGINPVLRPKQMDLFR